MASDTLEVIVFPGGFNWPLWAARKIGAFEEQGLEINLTNTPNSIEQLTGLIEGRYDIAMTAIDNVVAYQEGQGAAEVSREPDLFAFMGGDNGFLRLVVQSEIETFKDLAGTELSVDAPTTGYAFVLLKMLELGGLGEDQYTIVQAGGVMQRWDALKQGQHAGTLLITPFDILAEFAGLRVLQSASDILDPYQGLVGATRRSWAAENPETLVGFITAYREGLDWLFDDTNKDDALQILVDQLPNMTPELAAKIHSILLDPATGFEPEARLNVDGVKSVLDLRTEYGRPQKNLVDPATYFDLSYYDRATDKKAE